MKRYYIIFVMISLSIGLFKPMSISAQDGGDDIVSNETDTVVAAIRNKRNLIANAKKSLFTGDTALAKQLYRETIKLDSTCDVCHYELANILLVDEKYDEAKEHAEKAYALDPENVWFALTNAQLCFRYKEYAKAQKLLRHIIKFHGDKQEVWMNLAAAYEEQGLFDETEGVLDTMVMRFGETDDITYRLFTLYSNSGNNKKMLEKAEQLAENNRDDERFAIFLAEAYALSGKDSLALDAYDKAIGTNGAFEQAFLGKAEFFRKKAKFQEYFKCLQEFTANERIDAKPKMEYLNLVLELPSFANYFQKNIDTLFAILSSVHPASPEVKFTQAYYFTYTKRPEIALSLFNRLVGMDEYSKAARLGLLSLEYSMTMYQQLELSAKEAIESDPKYADYYMYLFLAQFNQKKTKSAVETLEKGIKHADYDSAFVNNAHSGLGDAYFSLNQPKKAFKHYDMALKLNPDNALVLNNYAYYLSLKEKELDKALEMSRRAVEIEGSNPSFLDTYAYILYVMGKYPEAKVLFRQAIVAGGGENAVVLEHYADTLYKLGEKSTAEIYWSQALSKPDCQNPEEIKKKLKR